MIRFLDLKGQIEDDEIHFAFYDTITDLILDFNDENVFSTEDEFVEAYNKSYMNDDSGIRPLERFVRLIPDNYFNYIKYIETLPL